MPLLCESTPARHYGIISSRRISLKRDRLADSLPTLRPRFHPALGTFLLLLALNLLNYIDRYILPGEVSLIQREFHATDQQMGALTTALFITYMLVAPLTGWLGDRRTAGWVSKADALLVY